MDRHTDPMGMIPWVPRVGPVGTDIGLLGHFGPWAYAVQTMGDHSIHSS